jgi:peptidoglycan/LPS O-acetylase OafA/YrhL
LVIFMTMERSERVQDFAISRFTRLFPLYWCCVLLSWTVVHLAGSADRKVGLGSLIVNLTLLEGLVGVNSADGVYWTLTVELAFYIGMALELAPGLLKGRRQAVTRSGWWWASSSFASSRQAPWSTSRYTRPRCTLTCSSPEFAYTWATQVDGKRLEVDWSLPSCFDRILESRLSGYVITGTLVVF